MMTVLYFSIINVFWLLNLCGAGGDASFAPQANLVGTHSNNVLIWFIKRFSGNYYFVHVSQMSFTNILSTSATCIDSVLCHHIAYSKPTKRCFWISINFCICRVGRYRGRLHWSQDGYGPNITATLKCHQTTTHRNLCL